MSIRSDIKNIIKEIEPGDTLESEHKQNSIKRIDSGVEIFRIQKHAIPPKHLVSYTLIFDSKQQKVLLFSHKLAMKMLPSGGHIEVNELPLDAAQRELQEEIGVSLPLYRYSQNKAIPFFITVTDIAGNSTPHTDVSLRYIFEYDSSKEFLKNDEYYREYHGHKRFTFDEILSSPIEKFDEHMHRFTRKLQQHITKKQEGK